jgi:acetyl esterase/lipase
VLIEDRTVYDVKIRVYSLKNETKAKPIEPKPVMIFYHGGAYCIGDLAYVDAYLIEFVKRLDIVIVSVDYRLAPEFPHPAPTDDCYSATKYVLQNPHEFNADLSRLIVAGDSAGGNAAAVITQRLLAEKQQQPKLQILIYPWVQIANFMLPSVLEYGKGGMLASILTNAHVTAWYLGITELTPEMESSVNTNDHAALLTDPEERERIKSYFDVSKIPAEYKIGKSYYDTHSSFFNNLMYPDILAETHFLRKDQDMAKLFRKLYDPSVSPLLADHDRLVGLPKTYMIVFDQDFLKDEGLLYAERLKKAGVSVTLKFYENVVHGTVPLIDKNTGYQTSRDMQAEVIKFIQENV